MNQSSSEQTVRWRAISPLRDFLHTEAASGAVIVAAALAGLVLANTPWGPGIDRFWHEEAAVSIGSHTLGMPVLEWINSGLMTAFFLLVGLEIKREVTTGHLNSVRAALMPGVAALGGMVVPAMLFLVIASDYSQGWAIPVATDIALALGVVALFAPGLSQPLRAFLLALAVVDDIGAIIIIAVFYSHGGDASGLAWAAAALSVTVLLRLMNVRGTHWYVLLGALLWLGLHEGGVHATIAGVVMGLLAPAHPHTPAELVDEEELKDISDAVNALHTAHLARSSVSVVEWLEHTLHRPVGFVIVPLFAFANTGVVLSADLVQTAITGALGLGIIVGLLIGKPLGICVSVWLATKAGLPLPEGTTVRGLLTVGAAAGIGFTVSMFITGLALDDPAQVASARVSVLLASVLSAVLAGLIASGTSGRKTSQESAQAA